jgi:hypothetical protein
MPTTPLLSPTAVHDPPAVPSKTLSSEDDHHTLSERILTWSIDHLHLHVSSLTDSSTVPVS